MTSDSLHRIAEPLLAAAGLSVLAYAVAVAMLVRDGRRMKAEESAKPKAERPA